MQSAEPQHVQMQRVASFFVGSSSVWVPRSFRLKLASIDLNSVLKARWRTGGMRCESGCVDFNALNVWLKATTAALYRTLYLRRGE